MIAGGLYNEAIAVPLLPPLYSVLYNTSDKNNMAYRPDLQKIEKSYQDVLLHWTHIDNQLDLLKIGRKDTPFDQKLMENMLSAWEYIDYFIRKKKYDLLSREGGPDMLEINHRVHYGLDFAQREEYRKALDATTEKFSRYIVPIRKYYKKKSAGRASVNKIAAELYIAVLGQPQLFIEGNHRSGSIIASWVNLAGNKPPFVLSVDNALAFFKPAQEIKKFNQRSMWRSLTKLPKYKKDFKDFWVKHCSMQFVIR